MIEIPFNLVMILITCCWVLVRFLIYGKAGTINWKRECQLLLVYICIMVIARVTFFPFSKVDGKVQPLLFDAARIWPFRLNLIPLVNLLDYDSRRDLLLNLIGNTTMFIPVGVVWPAVFKELDNPGKVLAAGAGYSLCIEILQLPFFDRASDVDDLLLNTLGFAIGYGLYLLCRKIRKTK